MEGFFMAQVMWFGGTFAPLNWMECNGATIPIYQYEALFALLGTTYGGDGQTTFNLPDFRGRIPVGTGTGPGLPTVVLGEMAGIENATMTANAMPTHSHAVINSSVNASSGSASLSSPANNVFATTSSSFYHSPGGATGKLKTVTANVAAAGGSAPFSVLMPRIGLKVLICTEGIFPIRS